MNTLTEKKIFLLATSKQEKCQWITATLEDHITEPTIFTAPDGLTALTKIRNAPPHVLIADQDLPKLPGLKLVDQILATSEFASVSIILIGKPPAQEHHLDEIVTGRVQYWTNEEDENEFVHCVTKALNYTSHKQPAEFHVRFLAKGDVLMKEGDKADNVYFVKKGSLQATHQNPPPEAVLGNIEFGEFVGEMAYINGEPRNANVVALTDCELIEVPIGHFEKVLYTRPSWSKALMLTLSKRLKRANAGKAGG